MSATNGETWVLTQRDARAEGGFRQVRVGRRDILIMRRFAGVSMRILAPTASYRGIALVVESADDGGFAYRLSLAHADPDFDVVLGETQDSHAAAADWRFWADYLALPRLEQRQDETRATQGFAKKAAFPHKRNAVVAKRRPRFLARRKRGDAKRTRAVFANEREIICYE